MTAPEQQPNDPTEANGANTAAPEPTSDQSGVPAVGSAPQDGDDSQPQSKTHPQGQSQTQRQPQYGQYASLEYGAMRSQFGPDYNPYLYGAPEPDGEKGDASGAKPAARPAVPGSAGASAGSDAANGANGANGGYGLPGSYPPPQGMPYRPMNGNGPTPNGQAAPDGHIPRYFHGIDVNDPNQNPLYGRWDSYAVLSFVFAVIFTVPVMPAVMGLISLWRTRTFNMKGRGLAIAAIVINVITTIVQVWMMVNGIDVADVTDRLLGMYGMGGDGSSGGSGSSGDSMSA